MHFEGITPEQRWRNEMLREIQENNRLLRRLLECNAQVFEQIEEVKTQRRGRRKGAAV